MATKIGDFVYVPCSKVKGLEQMETALYRTKIVNVIDKSVTVELPGGLVSNKIGISQVHTDVGILIIEFGDFISESATLDPLAKSVLQFCRLLVPDDQLKSIKIRSFIELKVFWEKNQAAYSHVVLIGHGDKSSLLFGADGEANTLDVINLIDIADNKDKTFISLACNTGYQNFGGIFSQQSFVKYFIGPTKSVHSAEASQFCQTLLTLHFLAGMTIKVAFNNAGKSVPGGNCFKLWDDGKNV